MNVREVLVKNSVRVLIQALMAHRPVRSFVLGQVEKCLHREAQEVKADNCPYQARQDKIDCLSALLAGIDRAISRGMMSRRVVDSMLNAFLANVLLNEDAVRVVEEQGFDPPSFVTISPTGRCNLKCKGCYASDCALKGKELDAPTFERILREKRELWGSHFTVISGGEPFLWRDGDLDLIRLAGRHREDVFLVYTNGTLIDDELARRLAEVGNITPSISVEGFEAETDARRGPGVHKRILSAFDCLRRHGVPFGISATATRDNWETIVSQQFADFYFGQECAIYGWIFQYMPIGRGASLEMVVPPESRVKMTERMWRLVRERKVLMVDFWNSGTASMGCISAGRGGGYFYINWDGDIMPCVFTPYAADNIHDLYARGDTITAALDSPLFRKIRQWQSDYGYDRPVREIDNWLCPCAIRDHFDVFAEHVRSCNARPINEEARQAIEDPAYSEGMVAYGSEMKRLTDPIWRERYSVPLSQRELQVDRGRDQVPAP